MCTISFPSLVATLCERVFLILFILNDDMLTKHTTTATATAVTIQSKYYHHRHQHNNTIINIYLYIYVAFDIKLRQ